MADRLASEQIGKDTFAATGKKLCTYQPVLPIRWLMDNVDGIESQVNSGDILFGTIDCWLIWKLTEGAVHAVASSNASSLGCYDLKEKKWYQPIFNHLKVPVSIFPEVLDDAADYGTTNLFGSPIPITGAIADQQPHSFPRTAIRRVPQSVPTEREPLWISISVPKSNCRLTDWIP